MNVSVSKTGVKHLPKICAYNYDVGVCFESNGHRTELFSTTFYNLLKTHNDNDVLQKKRNKHKQ